MKISRTIKTAIIGILLTMLISMLTISAYAHGCNFNNINGFFQRYSSITSTHHTRISGRILGCGFANCSKTEEIVDSRVTETHKFTTTAIVHSSTNTHTHTERCLCGRQNSFTRPCTIPCFLPQSEKILFN